MFSSIRRKNVHLRIFPVSNDDEGARVKYQNGRVSKTKYQCVGFRSAIKIVEPHSKLQHSKNRFAPKR